MEQLTFNFDQQAPAPPENKETLEALKELKLQLDINQKEYEKVKLVNELKAFKNKNTNESVLTDEEKLDLTKLKTETLNELKSSLDKIDQEYGKYQTASPENPDMRKYDKFIGSQLKEKQLEEKFCQEPTDDPHKEFAIALNELKLSLEKNWTVGELNEIKDTLARIDQENAIEKQLNEKVSRFYDKTYETDEMNKDNKQTVKEALIQKEEYESRFVNENYADEVEEAIDFIKKMCTNDYYETLDEDSRNRLINNYIKAQHTMCKQRDQKKYQKVKRVPPAPPGIDEIAHMIGEDKLASFLSVKRAKPLWPTVKDGLRTVLSRPKEVAPIEYKPIPATSPMTTVAKLEKLIGDLTTQELVVQRKLVLARKALFSATEKLVDMPFDEILELENIVSYEEECRQLVDGWHKENEDRTSRIEETNRKYQEDKKNYVETDPYILNRLAEAKKELNQRRYQKCVSPVEKPLEPLPQIEYGQD